MSKVSVMLARFPYQNQECPDVADWLVRTVIAMKQDPRVGEVLHARLDDTPITMTRNHMIELARKAGADYLCMIDSDMKPDCEPDGKPFWQTSFDFMLSHHGPCAVGAPYCGPPPASNVYVFRWANWMNDSPDFDGRLEQYTREEAASRAGFEQVAALPTGLFLLDMRFLAVHSKPPCFYYEWNETHSQKASTEDVTFTRDLSLLGIPQYVNWDAWAGHWKRYLARKPRPMTADQVRGSFKEAVLAGRQRGEQLIMQGEGRDNTALVKVRTFAPATKEATNGA